MRTAIDTNVLSAICSGEPSAQQLIAYLGEARTEGVLLVSSFVFAELHTYPGATEDFVQGYLRATGVIVDDQLEPRIWTETGETFCPLCGTAQTVRGSGSEAAAGRLSDRRPRTGTGRSPVDS